MILFVCYLLKDMYLCNIDINSKKNVEWTIPKEIINTGIYPVMFADFEYAGSFKLGKTQKDCKTGTCQFISNSKIDECNKGDASSVKTTDGYCNFHTHPFPCYKGENTLWGWSSGEDMRECIGFAMRGNLFHMIFALEGVYTIQVNPNILYCLYDSQFKEIKKIIPELKDVNLNILRGTIVSFIECYFRATHGHRTKEYNHKFSKPVKGSQKSCLTSNSWGVCMPGDWIEYANNFTLDNFLDSHNKCSRLLPCNKIPEYNSKKSGTISLTKYYDKYGIESYKLTKNGKISFGDEKHIKLIIDNFDKIAKFFNDIPCDISYEDEKWKKGQWFNCKLHYNNMWCPNEKKYIPFKNFMENCCKSNNIKDICKNIRKYWDLSENNHLQHKKQYICFPDIKMKFKPISGKPGCKLVKGNSIQIWLENEIKKKKK